jgi:hypothetical protein
MGGFIISLIITMAAAASKNLMVLLASHSCGIRCHTGAQVKNPCGIFFSQSLLMR